MIDLSLEVCSLYAHPIDGRGRDAEKQAVADIVREIFGDRPILHRDDGSPYIQDFEGCISVSHGAGTAVLAVSDTPVGVDIEENRAQLQRVSHKFVNPEDESPSLLHAWTAKEAAFKAAGIAGVTVSEIVVKQSAAFVRDRRFALRYIPFGPALIALATPAKQ
ncbi:MAG: hypothetical protein K2I18_05905 [Paramuribaculum sp.]|nr:hypothetical protein [Paramuribaculum sp.]